MLMNVIRFCLMKMQGNKNIKDFVEEYFDKEYKSLMIKNVFNFFNFK